MNFWGPTIPPNPGGALSCVTLWKVNDGHRLFDRVPLERQVNPGGHQSQRPVCKDQARRWLTDGAPRGGEGGGQSLGTEGGNTYYILILLHAQPSEVGADALIPRRRRSCGK